MCSSGRASSEKALSLTLEFESRKLGRLDYAAPSKDSSIEKLAKILSPLLAWNDMPWSSRLQMLRSLWGFYTQNESLDWVGIYRRDPHKTNELIVSAYYGSPTPHERIPVEKGICGAAIREEQSVYVPDVKQDDRFLACSLTTKSELVVPIKNAAGESVAEIDIDCTETDGFSPQLVQYVEKTSREFSQYFEAKVS